MFELLLFSLFVASCVSQSETQTECQKIHKLVTNEALVRGIVTCTATSVVKN